MKIGLVGKYPPPNVKHWQQGGEHLSNLINSLDNADTNFVLFVNKINGVDDVYYEGNRKIVRCWTRSLIHPFQILRAVKKEKPDIIHLQQELFYYANGLLAPFMFIVLLFLLSFLHSKIIVTIHGVVPLTQLDKKFMIQNRIRGFPLIAKIGLFLIFSAIIKCSDKIIVHEEKFKKSLVNDYKSNKEKIEVIPLGIEERKDGIVPLEAKKNLGFDGKKLVLFFGFITGYKGLELLIESFKYVNDNDIHLMVCGGEHPRLKNEKEYHNYVAGIKAKAASISRDKIIFTGFVQEKDIPLYFSAADVVIIPYTVGMSSSGPITLALSYGKPFLVSDAFREIVTEEELVFHLEPVELAKKIQTFFLTDRIKVASDRYRDKIFKTYKWEVVGSKTLDLYRFCMNSKELQINPV